MSGEWRRAGRALALALVACAAACGGGAGGGGQGSAASAPPPTTAAAGGTSPCHPATPNTAARPAVPQEPALTIDPAARYTAVLATSCGSMTLDLLAAKAPHTVNSFVFLAGRRYFDSSPCHRLTTAGIYVLQCGDPTGSGSGGPGYTIPDENLAGATYPAGTVAMANTGQPHSGGSQFFLVYRDTSLPPAYTPFARISAGLDVLQQIAAMGTTTGRTDGAPKAGVVLESVTATRAP